jgi:hypothetical protein
MSTAAMSKRTRSTTASDTPQDDHHDDDDDCSQMIHDLPTGILQNILGYLPLTSRAHLSCSGNKLLYDLVQSFNYNLITTYHSPSSSQDAVFNAQREELINIIEKRKWLRKDNNDNNNNYKSHLHRLIKGDHLAIPDQVIFNTHGWDSDEYNSGDKYKRKFKFYSDGKLIDDHLWVLYSDYWYSFEIFNLDTRRGQRNGERFTPENGPNQDYFNDDRKRISLELLTYNGGFGLLAAAMQLGTMNNPHGAWSGPYVSVWDLSYQPTEKRWETPALMSIDLYKPEYRIKEVCVVSRDKLCILLASDTDVELQWHKIPQRSDDGGNNGEEKKKKSAVVPIPTPDQPGEEPPMHQCTINCNFFGQCKVRKRHEIWEGRKAFHEEQDDRRSRRESSLQRGEADPTINEKSSYESPCEYPWWPAQSTLLQSNKLTSHFDGSTNATMTSDGKGLLVIIVMDELKVWHVGTMNFVRDLYVFQGHFFSMEYEKEMIIHSLTMGTILRPIDDVMGEGEGAYYNPRDKPMPELKPSRSTQSSKNYIDLTTCDNARTILSRFGHLTYDEQRAFEAQHSLQEGSCSPQLDCIVRIAFAVKDKAFTQENLIIQMDVNPFQHLRHRESYQFNEEEDDGIIEEELEEWRSACSGGELSTSGWCNLEKGLEQGYILSWCRGGIFDYEGGPRDSDRDERLRDVFRDEYRTDLPAQSQPVVLKKMKDIGDISTSILSQRSISCLAIDEFKLVVCTAFEVAVLPHCLSGTEGAMEEDWTESFDEERGHYLIKPNTPVYQAFRPLDSHLLSKWNDMRYYAFDSFGQWRANLDRGNTFQTITEELNESFEKEKALMEAAKSHTVSMTSTFVTCRYIAMTTPSLTGDSYLDENGYELLHVFDTLADRDERHAEDGLHFREDDDDEGEERAELEV